MLTAIYLLGAALQFYLWLTFKTDAKYFALFMSGAFFGLGVITALMGH